MFGRRAALVVVWMAIEEAASLVALACPTMAAALCKGVVMVVSDYAYPPSIAAAAVFGGAGVFLMNRRK